MTTRIDLLLDDDQFLPFPAQCPAAAPAASCTTTTTSFVRTPAAGKYPDRWCTATLRSRFEPMREVARTMRGHCERILNWFRARGTISGGAVEGLNNKQKVTFRRSYGFRTFRATEVALYRTLGKLPEPAHVRRFF